jgi:dienelactone hydrolase
MVRLFARALSACFTFSLATVANATTPAPPTYAYDAFAPLDLNIETTADEGNVTISSISYRSQGQVLRATLVAPAKASPSMPGVLFVRDADASSAGDASVFFDDAKWLARRGGVSLIPDFTWTLPGWSQRLRSYATDARDTVANVIDIRRSLDMLAASDGVDKSRLALVGQGIGATYDALMTGVDSRPIAAVFAAPELSLAKRFEAGAKPPPDPAAYEAGLAVFDTRAALGRSSFAQSLLQFAKHDRYVPASDANDLADAVPGNNKSVVFYDTGHTFALDAVADERRAWLAGHLIVR